MSCNINKINSAAPKLDVSSYYKSCNLEYDAARMKELDKENINLLRRLYTITQLGRSSDWWMKSTEYKSNLNDQQVRKNIITKSNKMIIKKISVRMSQYPTFFRIHNSENSRIKSLNSNKWQYNTRMGDTIVERLLPQTNTVTRTRCFFEIEIQETKQKLGTILFELYDDIVPQICAKFAELCSTTEKLSFRNTPFHRIVSGYWCQGGDVTKLNGTGGFFTYSNTIVSDNGHLRHTGPGLLSANNVRENGSSSKFNLTFKKLETMDSKNIVFGKVISGLSNVYKVIKLIFLK